MHCSVLCRRNVNEAIKIARISIKREWVRLIIKQPIEGWFSSAFSQSPTIPPTEDRGLWQRDCVATCKMQ